MQSLRIHTVKYWEKKLSTSLHFVLVTYWLCSFYWWLCFFMTLTAKSDNIYRMDWLGKEHDMVNKLIQRLGKCFLKCNIIRPQLIPAVLNVKKVQNLTCQCGPPQLWKSSGSLFSVPQTQTPAVCLCLSQRSPCHLMSRHDTGSWRTPS